MALRKRRRPKELKRHTRPPSTRGAGIALRLRAMPELGEGYVEGVVTVYGVEYDVGWGWREVIQDGAFAESLAEKSVLPIMWEHDWDAAPIGTGVATSADGRLTIAGQLFMDDPRARNVWRSMVPDETTGHAAIDEWSVAFWAEEITWTDEDPELDVIVKGRLAEATICVRGANPETETLEVRSRRRKARRRTDGEDDPGELAAALDATLDEVADALEAGDAETAAALVTAAGATVDTLLDALGVDDVDEPLEEDSVADGNTSERLFEIAESRTGREILRQLHAGAV